MPAVIFNGAKTKNLKDELQLTTGSSFISRVVDPTSVATAAEPGSLLSNPSTGNLYKKLDSGSTTNWQLQTSGTTTDQSYELSNLGLAASVAANALTIALKDKAGADPSGGSVVRVGFRNATLTTGQYSTVSISSALSLVVSSGSTLGTSDGVDYYLYVYLLNNAGTAELAVSMSYFEDGTTHSTTAEGGAGAADSNRVLYSTTARTNVATRLIGRILVNQATAGTWATAPSEISLQPFEIQKVEARASGSSTVYNSSGQTIIWDSKNQDSHNALDISTGEFTLPKDGTVYCIYSGTANASSAAVTDSETVTLQVNDGMGWVDYQQVAAFFHQTTTSITPNMKGSITYPGGLAGYKIRLKVQAGYAGSTFDGSGNNHWSIWML